MINSALASLAFSAGMVSFVNPCGFALLPVYIAYYFRQEGLEKSGIAKRLLGGLLFGLMVSLGFAAAFSIIGILVSFVGKSILKYAGWIDLAIGIILVFVSVIFIFRLDEKISFSRLTNFGERLKSNKLNNKYASFFLYGAGFAIASLGCTLPIFLVVVTSAIKSAGLINGLMIFLIYAAGMSFFMMLFSLATAISKTFVDNILSNWIPNIYRLGSIIILAAGIYLIYNQVVFARLLG